MPIIGKYFPSQQAGEKVFLLLRRHWFTYVIFVFTVVMMTIPLMFFIIYWMINPTLFEGVWGNIAVVICPAYILLVLALILFGFVDYYLDVYIVTNERIIDIKQNGFFKREIAELHLRQIQDVSAKVRGAFATLLHFGNIHIQTAAEKENFVFRNVPNPYRISKRIVDLHQSQLRRKRLPQKDKKKLDKDNPLGISANTLSKVRQETKNYLRNGDSGEIEGNLEEMKSEEILEGINNDEKTAKENGDVTVHKVNGVKSNNRNRKGRGTLREGEMHENEEIDIN